MNLKKLGKTGWIVVCLLVLYTVVGFWLIPAAMLQYLPKYIKQATARESVIEDIQYNPFSLELSLRGFTLRGKNGQQFTAFEEFYVNLGLVSSIREFMLTFDQIRLEKPSVRIEKLANGELDIADLLMAEPDVEPEPEQQQGEIFPFKVAELRVREGEFLWQNSALEQPAKEKFQPINLSLDNFTTRVDGDGQLGFSMRFESGGDLAWDGMISVDPWLSKGRVSLQNLNSNMLWKLFLQDKVNFHVKQGEKTIEADYQVSYVDDVLSFNVQQGRYAINKLILTERGGDRAALEISQLSVDGIQFNLNEQQINIASVTSSTVDLNAWANPQGELNFQYLFAGKQAGDHQSATADQDDSPETEDAGKSWQLEVDSISLHDIGLEIPGQPQPLIDIPEFSVRKLALNLGEKRLAIAAVNSNKGQLRASMNRKGELSFQSLIPGKVKAGKTDQVEAKKNARPGDKTQPWQVQVGELAIKEYHINFLDHSTSDVLTVDLSPLDFSVTGFSNQPGNKLQFELGTDVNKQGQVKLKGSAELVPLLTADLNLELNEVGLQPFQPYVNQFARLDIIDGRVNVKGKAVLNMQKTAGLDVNFTGSSHVSRLHTRDRILHKDFVKWQDLSLKKIAFQLQPVQLNIAEVQLKKPYARLTIREDQSINVSDLIVEQESTAGAEVKRTASGKSQAAELSYKIGKITVEKGSSDFSDFSLILPFVVRLNDLQGVVSGLSSHQKSKTGMVLQGRVYDLSPVNIIGEFSPNFSDMDVSMLFKSMPLPFVTPYMADFAGYKIDKGKMSLDVRYQIDSGRLTAENNLLIDQLTLGEEVENPDAISLPLKLAIALMKDADGKIDINLPITGSLEDPEFSVGALLVEALVNVITKIAASPFQAMASVLGSGEDFSTVSFTPGSAELNAQQKEKINKLAKALKERPDLKLEIRGTSYEQQDWPEMQKNALLQQLKQLRAEELKKDGQKLRAETIELSEDQYNRLLAQLFMEKFPQLGERSFFGTPRLVKSEMGDFYVVAQQKLAAIIPPDQHQLFILAAKRARNIARHLIRQGGIAGERVFVLDGKIDINAPDVGISSELSLKV